VLRNTLPLALGWLKRPKIIELLYCHKFGIFFRSFDPRMAVSSRVGSMRRHIAALRATSGVSSVTNSMARNNQTGV